MLIIVGKVASFSDPIIYIGITIGNTAEKILELIRVK